MNETHFDWAFGLKWMIVCTLGVAITGLSAFISIWTVGEAVEKVAGETLGVLVAGGLFGALFSLGASFGPGILLKKDDISASRWVVSSIVAGAVGMSVGFAVAFSFLETMPEATAGLFMGLSLGIPLGIAQRSILRRHGIEAKEWPAISLVAFLVAFTVGVPLGGEGREWIALGAVGLLLGVLTALGMVWIRRKQTVAAV
jgi:hypothetical protein